MLLIAHRGNVNGPSSDGNKPEYILHALEKYHVEIDVWVKGESIYLGHDEPLYQIDSEFLLDNRLWCHAKNSAALEYMNKFGCHHFWHENDKYTLTSLGYIWTYPGMEVLNNSVLMANPDHFSQIRNSKAYGVCSDYISEF